MCAHPNVADSEPVNILEDTESFDMPVEPVFAQPTFVPPAPLAPPPWPPSPKQSPPSSPSISDYSVGSHILPYNPARSTNPGLDNHTTRSSGAVSSKDPPQVQVNRLSHDTLEVHYPQRSEPRTPSRAPPLASDPVAVQFVHNVRACAVNAVNHVHLSAQHEVHRANVIADQSLQDLQNIRTEAVQFVTSTQAEVSLLQQQAATAIASAKHETESVKQHAEQTFAAKMAQSQAAIEAANVGRQSAELQTAHVTSQAELYTSNLLTTIEQLKSAVENLSLQQHANSSTIATQQQLIQQLQTGAIASSPPAAAFSSSCPAGVPDVHHDITFGSLNNTDTNFEMSDIQTRPDLSSTREVNERRQMLDMLKTATAVSVSSKDPAQQSQSNMGGPSGPPTPKSSGGGNPRGKPCRQCGGITYDFYPPWGTYTCTNCAFPIKPKKISTHFNLKPIAKVVNSDVSAFASFKDPRQKNVDVVTIASSRHQQNVDGVTIASSQHQQSVNAGASASSQHQQQQQQQHQRQPTPSSNPVPGDFRDLNLDGDSNGGSSTQSGDGPSPHDSSSSSDDDEPGGGGPGGGGGGGPPGPPSDDGIDELLGGGRGPPDLSWSVIETDCYKDKDLVLIKCPDIPMDSAKAESFWNAFKTELSAIDRSLEDILTKWLDVCKTMLGDLRDVIHILDNNSQGLIRLDRFIAKMLLDKGKDHPIFSLRFSSYISICHNQNRSPKGRVLLAMVAQRFRLDRSRGKAITLLHLYKIELESYKLADVQSFTLKVRHILGNLRPGEILDKQLMFDWLFEKFKAWTAISSEIKRIRKSRENSSKRTWKYLWTAIHNYIEYYYEDANQKSLASAIAPHPNPSTKALPGKQKKGKKEAAVEDPPPDKKPTKAEKAAALAAAAALSAKGKGKDKGKAKAKAKAKAAVSPADPAAQSARDKAIATAPADRSPEQKKLIGCRFFANGNCSNGDNCAYSHKDADIQITKKRIKSAAAKQSQGDKSDADADAAAAPADKPPKKTKKVKGSVSAAILAGIAPDVADSAPTSAPKNSEEWGVTKFVKKGLRMFSRFAAATSASTLPSIGTPYVHSGKALVANANHMTTSKFERPNSVSFSEPEIIEFEAAKCPKDHAATNPISRVLGFSSKRTLRHVPKPSKDDNVVELEYIMDSGAGRSITSKEALISQGVPKALCDRVIGPSSTPMTFETGGGNIYSNKSLQMTAPIMGQKETYILPNTDCLALAAGEVVADGKPQVWLTGQKPFHVTDPSKLTIICPLKYRLYADRVEENVPIYKEKVTLGSVKSAKGASNVAPFLPAISDAAKGPPDGEVTDAEFLHPSVAGEDLDELISVTDVVCEDTSPDTIVADDSIRVRSMSRRALILEAESLQHKRDHYPHNPFCEICIKAHMKQKSVNRLKEREDDQLPAVKAPLERLSADSMIVQKSREGKHENYVSFTIRDEFSGVGIGCPRVTRSKDSNYNDLKHFVGKSSVERPQLLVKSDAALEITGAVKELGWLPEPSLQNRFPHNAVHERWIGTLKSCIRSAVLQSGFPEQLSEWSIPYASMSLSLKQPCPIHKHERDAAGNVLPAFKHRLKWTCWQAFHGGEEFAGKQPIYGQLCFFLDDKAHTLQPRTTPGLFIGWKLESGLRYRGVLLIADYETIRTGKYRWRSVKSLHEKEVYFPEKLCFPFAEARNAALREMKPISALLPDAGDLVLPFADEAGEDLPKELSTAPKPAKITSNYRLSLTRLVKYGETPGCPGCKAIGTSNTKSHNEECKKRFSEILGVSKPEVSAELISDQGGVNVGGEAEGPLPDESSIPPSDSVLAELTDRTSKLSDVNFKKFVDYLEDIHDTEPWDQSGKLSINLCLLDAKAQNLIIQRLTELEGEASSTDHSPNANTDEKSSTDEEGEAQGPLPPDLEPDGAPSVFGASAKFSRPSVGRYVTLDMCNYVESAVTHYKTLAGVDKLKTASTPFCPEGSLLPEGEEERGELGTHAASILMKVLWAARLARPDLSRPTNKLTTKVQNWSRNDDKRTRRLIEYMQSTKNYTLEGFICDHPDDFELWLFADADLASDPDHTRSTNGAYLVLVGPSSWMPLSWLNSKQTSTSKSTTEAEGVSLVTALLQEAYPVWDLLELILGRKITLRMKEDNTATIKVLRKGYSPKLRHVLRTHKLNLGVVKEAIDDQGVLLEHIETEKQAADIFTKDLPPNKFPNALHLLGMRVPGVSGEFICGPLTKEASEFKGPPSQSDPVEALSEIVEKKLTIRNNGAVSACAIVDDIISSTNVPDNSSSEFSRTLDEEKHHALFASTKVIKAAMASSHTAPKSRPSNKLKGWGKLIELCTETCSNLTVASCDFDCVEIIQITAAVDWTNPETVRQTIDLVKENPGISLHASLPCTCWTTWQTMCVHNLGQEYWKELQQRRAVSIKMVESFVILAEIVIALGGHVSFEWPKTSQGWLIPILIAFITKYELHTCFVDGCALKMTNYLGEPILKRWRFVTTSSRMYEALSVLQCSHSKGFRHGEIQGGDTPNTAKYPLRLCRMMLSSLFGWYEQTSALPCITTKLSGHREKMPDDETLGGYACVPLAVSTACMSEVKDPPCTALPMTVGEFNGPPLPLVRGLVHSVLSWNETRTDPRAVSAVREEVEALAAIGTWDHENPIERDELIKQAQDTNTKIYVGEGLGICSIKNSELPESDVRRKYKGRFCYRTPTARDECGALAIFQEMSSRPTTIVSLNVAIMYGMIYGHATTVSDALKAYVQSYLNSPVPTFIEIARHLWPDKWKKLNLRRPCCRLIRALYGHPEAGGHWERHLTKIVVALGGKPIPNHPSCFWFQTTKLLLIIYVDDLLLSGPAHEHEKFWQAIAKDVNLDPPEPIDRYLGRHHSYKECRRLDYNLIESFASPVEI